MLVPLVTEGAQNSSFPIGGGQTDSDWLTQDEQASHRQDTVAAEPNPYPNLAEIKSAAHQALNTSASSHDRCRFRRADGQECGTALTLENVVGHCENHLRELTREKEREIFMCRWNFPKGGTCTKTTKRADLRKHVHTNHHTIKDPCPDCGKEITLRKDVIKKHLKDKHEYEEWRAEDYAAQRMEF
ncbi:hypothetical protein GYMLUDRAFT_87389 [Collybiopsis luxurians FD-317 M1]|uniref:Uncharacterized protein n=1 Tax=Collybiopsis luxurians FD-317 M1 TaxID=944289 RepID=A0A0D0C180_9AGAR|nr:hypothetical protein GYMLUDRAFT_87389 [Collybiopsis luxurians FD-317 M1]